MRPAIYVTAILALCALAPGTMRQVLVAAASVLLESLPYLAAAAAARPLLRSWAPRLFAYAGCGCAPGPSARSLPAALACALLFSPWAALARVAAGTIAARIHPPAPGHEHAGDLAAELVRLTPSALVAAGVLIAAPWLAIAHWPAPWQTLAGAILGIGSGPCALGTVALAATLRTQAPLAAYAALAAGGTIDLRALVRSSHRDEHGGALAYLALAAACAVTAALHGASLVHPHFALPLALCAVMALAHVPRSRTPGSMAPTLVATALLIAVVIGAPMPAYHASETTLADAFPGEHLDFTGVYRNDASHGTLVRYAITCCRADAHPVAALLARRLPLHDGTWVQARGVLARRGDALVFVTRHAQAIAPPHDPFVYE